MKFLLVSRFCTYPAWQGSAQHIRTFAKLLLDNNYEVKVVSGEYIEDVEIINQDGYDLIKVPIVYFKNTLEKFASISFSHKKHINIARKIINEYNPDIIHVGVSAQMYEFIDLAYQMNKPIVGMMHSYEWICMKKFLINSKNEICSGPDSEKCTSCAIEDMSKKNQKFVNFYKQFRSLFKYIFTSKFKNKIDASQVIENSLSKMNKIRNYINLFIVQSDYSMELLINNGVNKNNIKRINQWLSDEKLIRYPKLKKKNKKIILGYVGRLSCEKGLDIIGESLKSIKNLKNKFEFHIISNGGTRKLVEKFFGKIYNHDIKVKLYQNIVGDDLQKLISQLDVCLIPSICYEVGPRVLLESFAQKVPCITSKTIGNNYLITDNVNSKILNENSSDELQRILIKIIESPSIIEKWKKNIPQIRDKQIWFKEIIDLHQKVLDSQSHSKLII